MALYVVSWHSKQTVLFYFIFLCLYVGDIRKEKNCDNLHRDSEHLAIDLGQTHVFFALGYTVNNNRLFRLHLNF